MNKQELRELAAQLTAEYTKTQKITKCKTAKYKNITWPLERHPWGIFQRGRQKSQFDRAATPNTKYA